MSAASDPRIDVVFTATLPPPVRDRPYRKYPWHESPPQVNGGPFYGRFTASRGAAPKRVADPG